MANNNNDLPRLSDIEKDAAQPANNQGYNYQAPSSNMYTNPNNPENVNQYQQPPIQQAPASNPYYATNANMYADVEQPASDKQEEVNPHVIPPAKADDDQGDYNLMTGEDVNQIMRLGFIRKVYGILTFQLAITVSIAALSFVDDIRFFFLDNIWLFWTCLGISICVVIPLICCRNIARKVPLNYILLTIWTVCESYIVATCCSFYDRQTVITAAVMTVAVTVSLTIYACTTKTDFTMYGGILFVGFCLLIFFGLFVWVFGQVLYTFFCVLGVLVYSIYLIYDTQLVMGKFGNEYQIDDYIIAALMIYIDIIQIFLYLLQIFGRR